MSNDLTLARQLIKECQETENAYLDLGNCGIEDLNSLPELYECVHLEALNLSSKWFDPANRKWINSVNSYENNSFNDIPIEIERLKNLKKLIVCRVGGKKLKDCSSLKKLIKLKYLDLNNTHISNYNFLEKLTELQVLNLGSNAISGYDFWGKLTKLQYLDLNSTHIYNYNFLEKLTELQSLDLSNNYISDTHFLKGIVKLKYLDLRNNRILSCLFLEKFASIEHLDLRNNHISDIRFLEKLTTIQSLDLSENKISEFLFLQKLTNLISLSLRYNRIKDISFLRNLTRLQSLDLSENEFSDIRVIGKFVGLQKLNLSRNQISNIRPLKRLIKIESLDLSINEISDFRIIQGFVNLKSLDLSRNQSSNFGFLKGIIGLQSLQLNRNQISDIEFLKNLVELKSLDLSNNYIKNIPRFAFTLDMNISLDSKSPNSLYLYDNPIESPPLEIINQGTQSVLDWFDAKRKKLNEIKIILIGDPKTGKTSLLRMLKENQFDSNEVQTDGINIEHVHFKNCLTFRNQIKLHELTAHFWDFGGQEIMNATHQFFLTNRSVYILVLDARKDANVSTQIGQWIKRLKATSGNSPIIVAANQADVNPGFGFSNEVELKLEFPEIKYFIKTSCKTEEGIELIKQKLEELIPNAELFNTTIDERWIKIKEQLQEETKSKHFLDETRFLEICKEHELNEKAGRINAINFLNDLGLVLHFEDLNLAQYYVLDPYWITYGIYQIVTSSEAARLKGVVNMDRIEYIVNEEEDKKSIYQPAQFKKIIYDTNQRRFLVDILNQFKLSFYLADRQGFIIPDLLDTSEPTDITGAIRNAPNPIQFVYKYDYLPNSIMPYVMVEAHQIVKEMWRTGCVLQDKGSKALISSYQDMLTITTSGVHKKKREFMAVIRHLMDSINQKLSVNPQMLIPLPGISAFADYEVLLNMEKAGETVFIFDQYKQTESRFTISDLLDGIPGPSEIEKLQIEKLLRELLFDSKDIKRNVEIISDKQDKLTAKLDAHYEYLIHLPQNSKMSDKIIEAVKEVNALQTADFKKEILERIADAFTLFNGDMDDKLGKMYDDLKKTDDLEAKLKLSVPLINLLGIEFGVEWDVKTWATKMYEKYKLKVFQLMV